MKKYKKGFTLIEILIVIGIIAVLAAVVLVAINPARQFKQARDSGRLSNLNAILNAIGQKIVDNKGVLPAGIPAAGASAVEIDATLCAELVPTYLPSLPTDPSSDKKGASVTVCSEAVANAIGYEVSQDSASRITISAPDTELASTSLSVTR